MNNILILADSRQKNDKYITDYFDKKSIPWVRTCLPSADYMAIRYTDGFIKDYSILIDTKKDMEEITGNLCNSQEHERVKREILKAKELGCKRFIFLISDDKIKNASDLMNWNSKKTKVKGVTIAKIMSTMAKKYGVEFIFTSKEKIGERIVEILSNE